MRTQNSVVTLGPNTVRHPATYSDHFIPRFAQLLKGTFNVLDPMAGTGKLARIKEHGYCGRVVCNELEQEWVVPYPVNEWHHSDAANMPWAADNSFDAMATSPTYANRMADHHNANDGSRRITYTHRLGKMLHPENTGRMQWGLHYRIKHREIWRECIRVLKCGGIFVLNVSDHIRDGRPVPVVEWHKTTLLEFGLTLVEDIEVSTRRMGYGANSKLRVHCEHILVWRKLPSLDTKAQAQTH